MARHSPHPQALADLHQIRSAPTALRPPSDFWTLLPGDVLTGVVTEFAEGRTRRGPARRVLIEASDGERRWLWLVAWRLRSEFDRLGIEPGDSVKIRHMGQHPRGYVQFQVEAAARRPAPKRAHRPPWARPAQHQQQSRLPGLLVPAIGPPPAAVSRCSEPRDLEGRDPFDA